MKKINTGKRKETLAEGLNRSADKEGLKGKARERYIIGGAIHTYSGKRTPRKKREKSAPKQHKRIELVAKKNASASAGRSYDVYSIYERNKTAPYNSATFRTRAAAVQAAKTAQEQNNHPKGVHEQNKLV